MSDVKLGQLIDGEAARDCLHIAVAPVVACEELMPGEHVGIQADGRVGKSGYCIGIVDPFLRCSVPEGGKFWLFLYQNTVTGMRHQWAHPSFGDFGVVDKRSKADESEHWLREFADEWNMDYGNMIQAALYPGDGNYLLARGMGLHGAHDLGGDHELFWHHMEVVHGKRFDEAHKEKAVWTCTC